MHLPRWLFGLHVLHRVQVAGEEGHALRCPGRQPFSIRPAAVCKSFRKLDTQCRPQGYHRSASSPTWVRCLEQFRRIL
jgi:hypothetical protein